MKSYLTVYLYLIIFLNFGCDQTNNQKMTPPEMIRKSSMESEAAELKTTNAVDILFVIDNSESMLSHQDNLSKNIHHFVQSIEKIKELDYHIGVTTIFDSTYGPVVKKFNPKGFLIPLKKAQPGLPFNYYTREHKDLQLLSESLLIGVIPLKDNKGQLQGPQVEEVFSPVLAAVTEPAISSINNAGFYRPEARLAVILVTDADDSSPGLSGSQLHDELKKIKSNPDGSLLSYFGLLTNKKDCKVDPGMTYGVPQNIIDFINSNQGQVYSLCNSKGLESVLSKMGDTIINKTPSQKIALKSIPEYETLKVYLGDVELKPGPRTWGYDPARNLVIMTALPQNNLPESRKIRIEYTIVNMENLKNGRSRKL